MVQYLYRGNEDEPFVEELREGAITGAQHNIFRGHLLTVPDDPVGDDIEDLDWGPAGLEQVEVPVTGGVTDSLAQTHRFSGGSNYAMVLDADAVPFEEIQYDYYWFNDNPGVFDHVLSSSAGEIRLLDETFDPPGDLWGTVKYQALMSSPDYYKIRHWGTGTDLPATTPRSGFAEEEEWVAQQEEVTIKGAIEGVVSFVEPLGVRVRYTRGRDMVPADAPRYDEILAEVYESYREPLPEWTTFYLLVIDDLQDYKNSEYGGFRQEDILAAYRDDGPVDEVPPRFRGEAG